MRILKTKIALAKAKKAQNEARKKSSFSPRPIHIDLSPSHSHSQSSPSPRNNSIRENRETKKRNRIPGFCMTPESSRAIKNIVKNFGRAICAFAVSELAKPYLMEFAEKEGVELKDFVEHVHNMKSKIDGLFHFRSLLLKEKGDEPRVIAYKNLFKEISEIFIKYFSVNWIFHSKVHYKQAHLKFRFKILRRIQKPELFTYLQSSKMNGKNKQK